MTRKASRFVRERPRIPGASMPVLVQGTEFTRVLAVVRSRRSRSTRRHLAVYIRLPSLLPMQLPASIRNVRALACAVFALAHASLLPAQAPATGATGATTFDSTRFGGLHWRSIG